MGGSIKKCKQESGLAWSSECPYFISFLSITAAGTLNPSLAVRGQNPRANSQFLSPFLDLLSLGSGCWERSQGFKAEEKAEGVRKYPQIQSLPGTTLLEYKRHGSVDSSGF